jgi:peptidoglycan/xylan/chitin deacetylase (PgdA/CDA1 family)
MIFALPPAIVAGELVRLQTPQRVVALTFDGGGNAESAHRVLAVLQREHVRATFFLTGHFVKTYPALARAIGRRYPVGNHTVNHFDLTRMPISEARREIVRAATMIQRATGRDTRPYFRFPYGARNERTLRLANGLGYASVRWTVDTWGWMGRSRQSVSGATRRVVDHLLPGEIVLMHLGASRDSSTIDSRALPGIIRAVRARGYRFVTLAGVRSPRRSEDRHGSRRDPRPSTRTP